MNNGGTVGPAVFFYGLSESVSFSIIGERKTVNETENGGFIL